MSKLSTDAQQAIVEKALAKDGRTLTEIAKTHNVARSTCSTPISTGLLTVIYSEIS